MIRADLYAFLATDPNSVVEPIHPKAMPVVLTEPEEIETWMNAPWSPLVSGRLPAANVVDNYGATGPLILTAVLAASTLVLALLPPRG